MSVLSQPTSFSRKEELLSVFQVMWNLLHQSTMKNPWSTSPLDERGLERSIITTWDLTQYHRMRALTLTLSATLLNVPLPSIRTQLRPHHGLQCNLLQILLCASLHSPFHCFNFDSIVYYLSFSPVWDCPAFSRCHCWQNQHLDHWVMVLRK